MTKELKQLIKNTLIFGGPIHERVREHCNDYKIEMPSDNELLEMIEAVNKELDHDIESMKQYNKRYGNDF